MTEPVILGAGPAGCAAAIVLAKGGARPLLIDRDAQPRDPLCGGFLSWRTAARLRELGVTPSSLGAHQVTRLRLFSGRHQAQFDLPSPGFGLSRHAMDTALRNAALAAGARLEVDNARGIEGTSVIGQAREWPSESLFLATGKHDVRGEARPRQSRDPALGLRWRLPPSPERTRLLEGCIELHLFAGGYAGIVLQEDGWANVCLAVRKSRLAEDDGDPAAFLDRLTGAQPALGQRFAGLDAGRAQTVGAVPYGFIAPTSAPGLFRLGDQAAVIPSLAGEGIAIALTSGVMAAGAWLEGGAAAAPVFQRAFAARAKGPVRIARAVWGLAEHALMARMGIALAANVPGAVRALMNATRLDVRSLARMPSHP